MFARVAQGIERRRPIHKCDNIRYYQDMFYTKELCQRIRDLRMSGHSIPEISNILQIPKTTVLRKVKGVEILPQYYQRWLDRKKRLKCF